MNEPFIIAGRRSPVAPRNGAFRNMEVTDIAAPLVAPLLEDANVTAREVDEIILGNALYAGGNPARMISLAAGLPERIPALTVDSQCCAGLDAILIAASRIRAGEADIIVAGGAESYSRSPLRARRPSADGEDPAFYDRPPFSPWADRDPDLIEAAAVLAGDRTITRDEQERFAICSHGKAADCAIGDEIVPMGGLARDAFTRRLSASLCSRLPVIAGDARHGLTATTIAVEADAAALVLVVSERVFSRMRRPCGLRIRAARRIGVDPAQPATGAQAAAAPVLEGACGPVCVVELMESFAVQAMAAITDLRLDPATVNRGGGALSRGHPIGASGAILAVRLFAEMRRETPGALGLAAIAAAGGLGSAALFERV